MREFIGYNDLIKNFTARCKNGNLSHAHLITGDDGIGKSRLADILAKLIIDGDFDKEYVDIINYKCKKSSFGVDDVRNIIEEVSKKPFEGENKVIIIHDGNRLTVQAQNALLKTIEEPPKGVYIIILCESLELILDTIKSRCEVYKLTPLSKKELYKYIEIKGYTVEDNQLKSAIAFSEGIPGRIDRYFNDESLQDIRDKVLETFNDLCKNDIELMLAKEEQLASLKESKEDILNIFGSFIRDILIYKEIENNDLIINNDKIDEINELTKEMTFKKLNNMVLAVADARKNIKGNVSWPMAMRVMLMSFMEG